MPVTPVAASAAARAAQGLQVPRARGAQGHGQLHEVGPRGASSFERHEGCPLSRRVLLLSRRRRRESKSPFRPQAAVQRRVGVREKGAAFFFFTFFARGGRPGRGWGRPTAWLLSTFMGRDRPCGMPGRSRTAHKERGARGLFGRWRGRLPGGQAVGDGEGPGFEGAEGGRAHLVVLSRERPPRHLQRATPGPASLPTPPRFRSFNPLGAPTCTRGGGGGGSPWGGCCRGGRPRAFARRRRSGRGGYFRPGVGVAVAFSRLAVGFGSEGQAPGGGLPPLEGGRPVRLAMHHQHRQTPALTPPRAPSWAPS